MAARLLVRQSDLALAGFSALRVTRSTVAKQAVAARKADMETRCDMMQHWLDRSAMDPENMREFDIISASLQNLGAGGDTAGSVLQAFYYFLLKGNGRALKKKLRVEIDGTSARGGVVECGIHC